MPRTSARRRGQRRPDHTQVEPDAGLLLVKRHAGRRSMLTPEREEALLRHVKGGNHLANACAAVGISTSTLFSWLRRADEVEEMIKQSPDRLDLAEQDWRYLRFRDLLQHARASAETKAVGVVMRSMEGGALISRSPALTADGLPIYDRSGDLVYNETFSQPDGRLAIQFLERSWPDRWGRNATQHFEVHNVGAEGPGGRPDPDALPINGDVVSALAARLADAKRLHEERIALEVGPQGVDGPVDDDIEDADVVDAEEG